jgi:hypothetical protein
MANLQKVQEELGSTPGFESAPWIAADRTIDEPRRPPEPQLQLETVLHEVRVQDGDSIRKV